MRAWLLSFIAFVIIIPANTEARAEDGAPLDLADVPIARVLGDSGNETSRDSSSVGGASFVRARSDQLTTARLLSGDQLTLTYHPTYGYLTDIADSANTGFHLAIGADSLLHRPLSQTIFDQATGATILTSTMTYEVNGKRARRVVSAGTREQQGTDYWYGGSLHPLVVDRDGVASRMIGKSIVEELSGNRVNRFYLHADSIGSVRMITDDRGKVVASL
jgi:hypothetical protein